MAPREGVGRGTTKLTETNAPGCVGREATMINAAQHCGYKRKRKRLQTRTNLIEWGGVLVVSVPGMRGSGRVGGGGRKEVVWGWGSGKSGSGNDTRCQQQLLKIPSGDTLNILEDKRGDGRALLDGTHRIACGVFARNVGWLRRSACEGGKRGWRRSARGAVAIKQSKEEWGRGG